MLLRLIALLRVSGRRVPRTVRGVRAGVGSDWRKRNTRACAYPYVRADPGDLLW